MQCLCHCWGDPDESEQQTEGMPSHTLSYPWHVLCDNPPPPPQICRDSHLFEFHQIIWWHEEMHLITYFVLLSLSWISIPIKRRRFLLHTFVINTTSSIQQYKTLKYNTLVSRFFFKMSVLFQISPFFKIETFLL